MREAAMLHLLVVIHGAVVVVLVVLKKKKKMVKNFEKNRYKMRGGKAAEQIQKQKVWR